jgi:serine/threonine protein kinase
MNIIVANKYIMTEKVGEGSFGNIYKGFHKDNKSTVAIKIDKNQGLLRHEAKIYNILKNAIFIPKIRLFGKDGNYSYLIMDLLNVSLGKLVTLKKSFSLKTTLMIILNILDSIEIIHSKNIVHRDIKPDNFMISTNKDDKNIYFIDFGLSKIYKPKLQLHPNKSKGMIGTARYASINTHNEFEYSWRDDMESLGYLFIYIYTGSLPWQGLPIKNKKLKLSKICEIKKTHIFSDIPKAFIFYLDYCKKMHFTDKPNYAYLKKLFLNLFHKNNFTMDYKYDWNV